MAHKALAWLVAALPRYSTFFSPGEWQLRHIAFPGHPVVNDPLYNHPVFGPARGRGGDFGGKPEDQLVAELLEVPCQLANLPCIVCNVNLPENFFSATCPAQVHSADTWLGEEEGPALRPEEPATNNSEGGRPPDDLQPSNPNPNSQPLKSSQSSRLDANCYECSVR